MVDMTHFGYSHLRPDLAQVSASFGELAHGVLNTLPMNAERTTCLRKLLEAKDCAVRAYLQGPDVRQPAPGEKPAVYDELAIMTARATAAEAALRNMQDAQQAVDPVPNVGAPATPGDTTEPAKKVRAK